MRSFIDVTILGNVGKTPEVKTFDGGFKVANFSIAVNEEFTDKKTGERRKLTEWVNVAVTNPKIIEAIFEPGYVAKGTPLLLRNCGIKTRSYEKDGVKRYNTEVTVGVGSMVQILERAADRQARESAPAKEAPAAPVVPVAADDIPF